MDTATPAPPSAPTNRHLPVAVSWCAWSIVFGVASATTTGPASEVAYHLAVWGPLAWLAWVLTRPGVERAWRLMGAGVVLFGIGDLAWDAIEWSGASPDASWADVVYLSGYGCLGLGIAVLLRTHGGTGRREGLIDGLLLAVPAVVLAVQFLVVPGVESAGTAFERVVAAAYPLADTVLLAGLVWLLVTPGVRRSVLAVMASAMVLTVVVDVAWAASTLTGADRAVAWWEAAFPLTYAVLAGGIALGARSSVRPPVGATGAAVPWGRVVLLAAGLIASPMAAALAVIGDLEVHPALVVAGTMTAACLVVARFVGLVNRLNRTADELAAARNEILVQSLRDPLTGVFNRHALPERLAGLGAAEGPGDALISIDLDRFKAVNDRHGHPAGDAVLEAVAERLWGCTRDVDAVVRMGGDEFLVVVRGVDAEEACTLADRMVRRISEPVLHDGRELAVSASAGVVVVPPGGRAGGDELLHDADVAMYGAKRSGGGVRLAERPVGR